jgi:hypothetical protein
MCISPLKLELQIELHATRQLRGSNCDCGNRPSLPALLLHDVEND